MNVEKLTFYLIIGLFRVLSATANNRNRSTANADLDSRFKRISETLQSLEKFRDEDEEQGTQSHMSLLMNRKPSINVPDEGSGSPSFSDDDDYGASGGSPIEEPGVPGIDFVNQTSTPSDFDIGLESIVPAVVINDKHTTSSPTSSSTTTTATKYRSTVSSSTISSTTVKKVSMVPRKMVIPTVSHDESPDYYPTPKPGSSAPSHLHFHRDGVFLYMIMLLCVRIFRWLM